MRLIRNIIRKIRYNLRFLNRDSKTKLNFTVNTNFDSELSNLMNLYGSDKGGKNDQHNYAEYYSYIFKKKRKIIKNFLEIGLGSNNTEIACNMGAEGKPLASLKAWRDYFPNAEIYGGDIDKNILKDGLRIKTFYLDQTDPTSISKMFKKIGDKNFDIILDDGLHEFSANICLFENSIKFLDNYGTYIIEDVYYKDKKKFIDYFKDLDYQFSLVDIYHDKNILNNCIVVIQKNNEKI
tara:strand:+ start:311 stop:1021 length:711 start_codon:yes stop_codon:yes gene_type:complete